jgi:hypothetical protein
MNIELNVLCVQYKYKVCDSFRLHDSCHYEVLLYWGKWLKFQLLRETCARDWCSGIISSMPTVPGSNPGRVNQAVHLPEVDKFIAVC